jgi:hypothetical protein
MPTAPAAPPVEAIVIQHDEAPAKTHKQHRQCHNPHDDSLHLILLEQDDILAWNRGD